MAVTVLSIDAIVSDPAIRGGRPIIAGTGVRVMDIIASHLYRKFSPEELAVQYNLALGQVYAALAYYYMHKSEVDADLRQSFERAEQLIADLDRQGKVVFLD
jgi:uncharacterized protein (DUF433 family)